MDSFEINKIIGAFLGVVFVVFSVSIISDAIFAAHPPHTPGYAIEAPEEGEVEVVEEEAVAPISVRLAEADTDNGESIFARCQSCHTVEEGGANKVGPNLWDVVGGPITHKEDFSYSSAMEEFSEGGEKEWTFERLDEYLTDPRGYVSGTAMAFAGLRDPQDRADLLNYLHTLSNDPVPLPEPEEVEESADAGDGDEPAGEGGDGEENAEGGDNGSDGGEARENGESGDDSGDQGAEDGQGSDEASGDEEAEAGSGDQEASDEEAADDEGPVEDETSEGGDQDDAEIDEEEE